MLLHSACAPYPSVVAHATAQAGVSLLHLAVQSGQPSMVSALLRSGRAHFFTWPWNIPGPAGTTPLHVAALAAGSDIALLALQTSPGGWVDGRPIGVGNLVVWVMSTLYQQMGTAGSILRCQWW